MDEIDDDALRGLVARIAAARGKVVAVELPPDRFQGLVDELRVAAYEDEADVRIVLGAACTTAARTVEHLAGVLQLPYAASRGWLDMLEAVGDRAASLRQCLVVADAADLVRHEDEDRWHELVGALFGGPYCLGGGWNTIVLADHPWRWEGTPFRSAAQAQERAETGRRSMHGEHSSMFE
ncbi:hypothetical protein ACQEVZ_22135 [Dactylosporangium sp. CA-152071]|uniref:hypothetical protein n=1 Tax=Dactylosporangium sp. CA-152071 TaxID=3239933 RepID=UPI003D933CD7